VVEVVVGSGAGAGGGVDTRFSAGTCQVVVVDRRVVDVVRVAGVAAFVVGGAAATFDLPGMVELVGAAGVAAVVGGSDP
jgi:hypothetical protein